jgi:hypothetical protein
MRASAIARNAILLRMVRSACGQDAPFDGHNLLPESCRLLERCAEERKARVELSKTNAREDPRVDERTTVRE